MAHYERHGERPNGEAVRSLRKEPGPAVQIDRIDHVVLTVRSIEASCHFYTRVLGMREVTFGEGRKALVFGRQKINLHQEGSELDPKAKHPTPGSADLCLVSSTPLAEVMERIQSCGVDVELGPVARTGALGPMRSVYVRDPDQNLIEIASYEGEP